MLSVQFVRTKPFALTAVSPVQLASNSPIPSSEQELSSSSHQRSDSARSFLSKPAWHAPVSTTGARQLLRRERIRVPSVFFCANLSSNQLANREFGGRAIS